MHALSLDTIGGVEITWHAYLAAANKTALEHHLLIMRRPCHPQLAAGIRANSASISYAKYWHGLKLPSQPALLRRRHLQNIFRRVRPDVAVMYSTLGNLELLQAARQAGATTVYYERGAAWMPHEPAAVRDFLAQVDVVLCNSNAARRMLELHWQLSPGRAQVILNPLRPEAAIAPVTPKSLPADRPLKLGVAGRLVPAKGHPLAIQALRQLKEMGLACELHIAGQGPDREQLVNLAEKLGLREAVHFHGHVREMTHFYQEIDLFIFPSIREPLGNVCLEAGYFGCPVICGAVDGLPEVVVEGRTGFCLEPTLSVEEYERLGGRRAGLPEQVYLPADDTISTPKLLDPAVLAEKVRHLVEQPELYAEMSRAAHQHIVASLNLAQYAESLDEALRVASHTKL